MHIADAFFELRTKRGTAWQALSIASIVLFFAVLLMVYMVPFIYFAILIFYVFDATGTLGWWWAYAIIALAVVSQFPKSWVYSTRPALYGAVIGLTPQMLFLSLYNSTFIQSSPNLRVFADAIKAYDRFLLRLRLLLESSEGNLVYLLAAIITVGAVAALISRKTAILRSGLAAFDRVKYAIYILWIGTVFTFSTSLPAGQWEPDVHSRLRAEQAKILRDTGELQLITGLQDELRTQKSAALARYHQLALALVEEGERLRDTEANRKRAEKAGVRALAGKALETIAQDIKIAASAETENSPGASDPIGVYEAERSRAESLDSRVEIAAESLKTLLIEVISPGAIATGLPTPRIFQEYLKEAIEEAAAFIAKQAMSRVNPKGAKALEENAMSRFRRDIAARSLAIAVAVTTPDLSSGRPRMPEVFRQAAAQSVREQQIERQAKEAERSISRRR